MSVRSISLKLDMLDSIHKAIKADEYMICNVKMSYKDIRHRIIEIEEHNRAGNTITILPMSVKYDYLMYDGLAPSTLRQLRNDGFEPCLRITYAKDTYQVIFRTKIQTIIDDNNIHIVSKIAETYKANQTITAYLPGFYLNGFAVATGTDSCRSISCPKLKRLLKL